MRIKNKAKVRLTFEMLSVLLFGEILNIEAVVGNKDRENVDVYIQDDRLTDLRFRHAEGDEITQVHIERLKESLKRELASPTEQNN